MSEFFARIESKNIPELRQMCKKFNVSDGYCESLCQITSMYLPINQAIGEIASLISGEKLQRAYSEIKAIYAALDNYGLADKLYLDFSIVNDMNYYDGIIFKGFINGIPDSILSGGRYDRLMERFGKKTEAIGFAVYLDKLERFGSVNSEYDVDVMLVYDADASVSDVINAINTFRCGGKTVKAVNSADTSLRCRERFVLTKEGVKSL